MKKAIKWIFIVVLVLVVGGGILLFANLDRIIKTTVEAQGTEQLKVPTTLGGVSLSLFGGSLALDNFKVSSPAGFSAPALMEVGGLSVDTGGFGNLRQEPMRVSSIRIDQPKLVIEQQDLKLNLKALMDGLPKGDEPTQTTSDKKPVKLIIDSLTVNNAHVVIRGVPGLAEEVDLPIAAIDLKNIGNADGANNGAAIKDVVTTVITAMARKAADNEKLPPAVRLVLAGDLDAIQNQAIGVAKKEINKLTGDLTKKLPPDVNNLLNKATGGNDANGQPKQGAVDNLLDKGFGALKGATSKPAK